MTQASRFYRPALAVAVVLMMVCMSLTVLFATTNSQAAFATLNKGDKWALQENREFVFSSSSTNGFFDLGADDGDIIRNGTITYVGLDATLGVYVLFEVVEANATSYVIKVTAAESITLDANASLNAQMIAPGQYMEWWDDEGDYSNPDHIANLTDAAYSEKTINAGISLTADSLQTILFTVDRESMNVTSIDLSSLTKVRGHVDANDIPNIYNLTDSWEDDANNRTVTNVTYDNYDLGLALDLNLTGNFTFEPGISLIGDGMAEGDMAYSEFCVNGTLNWNGMANISGLPSWITDLIFTDDAAQYGITGFPIDLAKIYYNDGDDEYGNGTYSFNMTEPTGFAIENYENATVNDPVLGTIAVNKFSIGLPMLDEILHWWYCPQNGHIVGIELYYPISDEFALNAKLLSAPVNEVQSRITEVSDYIAGTEYIPTVIAMSPVGSGVAVSSPITATFSQAMDPSTVVATVNGVPGTVSWNGNVATIAPSSALAYSTEYTVTVTGNNTEGTALAAPVTWTFTTMGDHGSISGIVKDANGNPVAGATVRLSNGMWTTTNASGGYVFDNVAPGTYTLNVTKDGYQSSEQSVTQGANQDHTVNPPSLQTAGSETTDKGSNDDTTLPWAIVVVLIVVVAALLGFMFFQNKKKKQP